MLVDWCWVLSRRRKKCGDPLFEEGDVFCSLASKQIPVSWITEYDCGSTQDEFLCNLAGCNKLLDSLSSYEAHYNSTHRNVCSQCKRVFPSNYLLELHVLEWHDSMFEILALRQPMYQCLLQACSSKFSSVRERKNHMIKTHKYPSNYRFDKEKKHKSQEKVLSNKKMDVCMEDEDDNVNLNKEANSPPKRQFTYKIPDNICFGQGVSRGFQRGRGRGRRGHHWHNKNKPKHDTSVDIEKMDMTDLSDALDSK